MTTPRHRVAIVGAGAMGAAASWQLSRRGHDVTVFEQFDRGHDRGSSHGNARIFRIAHTDPWWTDLAGTAWGGWDDLQEQSGRTLVRVVGGLDHGHPRLVDEVAASCRRAGIDHERLEPAAAAERWPGLRTDRAVVFHPGAGTTDAASTVAALLDLAERDGAELLFGTPVDRLAVLGDHVEVRPRGGPTRRVDRVVVTAGAWTASVLFGVIALPRLHVTREHPVEFTPLDAMPTPWPTVIHHDVDLPKAGGLDDSIRGYALPTADGRVKVGEHHVGVLVDPDVPGDADPDAVARVRNYVATWLPGLDPASGEPDTCLYTTTPSTEFVVDRTGPVVVAAGFSGHGFKYVPWVGRTVAGLVEGDPGPTRFRLPDTDARTRRHRPAAGRG